MRQKDESTGRWAAGFPFSKNYTMPLADLSPSAPLFGHSKHRLAGIAPVHQLAGHLGNIRPGCFYLNARVQPLLVNQAHQACQTLACGVTFDFIEDEKAVQTRSARPKERARAKAGIAACRNTKQHTHAAWREQRQRGAQRCQL